VAIQTPSRPGDLRAKLSALKVRVGRHGEFGVCSRLAVVSRGELATGSAACGASEQKPDDCGGGKTGNGMPSRELQCPVEHVTESHRTNVGRLFGRASARALQNLFGMLQSRPRLLDNGRRGPHFVAGRSGLCGTVANWLSISRTSPRHRWLLPLAYPCCRHHATCRA
jgi:hypothetical protein